MWNLIISFSIGFITGIVLLILAIRNIAKKNDKELM